MCALIFWLCLVFINFFKLSNRFNQARLDFWRNRARVQPAIQNILEMTGLDAVFPAFQSIEEAVDHLGGDPTEGDPAAGKKPVRHSNWR